MTIQLRPSLFRCAVAVVSALLVLAITTYFQEGYRENRWWTSDYMLSWLVPLVLVPVLIWFAFVPSRLEFSDTGLTIKFFFRSLHTLDWSNLHSYGPGENVFQSSSPEPARFRSFRRHIVAASGACLRISFLPGSQIRRFLTIADTECSGHHKQRHEIVVEMWPVPNHKARK
jgi:hypothetical protein